MATTSILAKRALRRLELLAAGRHGVFTRVHARECGVSEAGIGRLHTSGAVIRLHPGVYAFAPAPSTDRRSWMAAVDAASPGAHLSGDAALRLLGINKHCWSDAPVEVVVARQHRPATNVRFVRSPVHHREEWTIVDAIPVLRLERLLVERTARGASVDVLCALIDEGAFRKQLSIARMRRVLDRSSARAGNRRLRRALDQYLHGDGGAQSALEDRVGRRILAVVTGRVERNRRRTFGGKRMKPDILLPDIGVAIEIDGMHGHSRPTRRREDRARDDAYRRADFTPLRVRDTHEEADTAAVVAEVRRRQDALRV